jgi:xanthine dehydrogenase molybdenum-binding subunit
MSNFKITGNDVPKSDFKVVGKNVPKVDAKIKVTGRAQYADDVPLPNALHARIVRCMQYAHAKVTKLDISKAEKMPGVVKILVPEDIAKYNTYNTGVMDLFAPEELNAVWGEIGEEPIFTDYVKHQGEALCGIVAKTEAQAEAAAEMVEVEYEPLPVYLTTEEAAHPDAVQFTPEKPGNIAYKVPGMLFPEGFYGYGDIDKGFAESDLIYEEDFYLPKQKHCQMEPHSYIAQFDDQDRLNIWTSTQMPKPVQTKMHQIFGLPMSRVKVNQTTIGGGFGTRLGLIGEPYVAAMALALPGRVIKLNYTREEDWVASETRHSGRFKLKMGFKKDGTPVVYDAFATYEKGAYYTHGGVVWISGILARGTYKFENFRFDGNATFNNKVPCGAFRGYGNPQQALCMEQLIQRMCTETGIDTIEWHKKWHREAGGDPWGFGVPTMNCGADEVLERGVKSFDWYGKKENNAEQSGPIRRGTGMMLGAHCSAGFPVLLEHTVAQVTLNEDATAIINCSISDLGCGNHTAITQIAAETLGFAMEDVYLKWGDSDANAFDIGAHASRTIWTAGRAVKEACEDAMKQVFAKAAKFLKVDPADLVMEDKKIFTLEDQDKIVDLKELLWKGIYAFMNPEDFQFKFDRGQIIGKASFMPFANNPGWYACFVELEIDTETGEWKVLECTYVNDIGQAIHPPSVEGQLEGGIQQGLGFSLSEEMYYDENGLILNNSFTDYKMFGPTDMPKCDIQLVNSEEQYGPYGARGVGEAGLCAPGPAVANAIFDAVGISIPEAPFTPEKILKAIKGKKA